MDQLNFDIKPWNIYWNIYISIYCHISNNLCSNQMSVTEREIQCGIMQNDDALHTCLWFKRTFADIDTASGGRKRRYVGKLFSIICFFFFTYLTEINVCLLFQLYLKYSLMDFKCGKYQIAVAKFIRKVWGSINWTALSSGS